MSGRDSTPIVIAGVALAFALLIAAVWAADIGTSTGLALTGVILLVGVGIIATIIPTRRDRDQSDEQRDRMRQSTP